MLRIELHFVRETAFATRQWIERTSALFEKHTREQGFVYVDVTHEIIAQLRAWSPNLRHWLGFLREDIRRLSSDRLAALPEVGQEINRDNEMLADVEEVETDLGKIMPALLDHVSNKWEEMNTRIVIQRNQVEILKDIGLLNKMLRGSSDLALQSVNQQKEQLAQLLTQIEDKLQTSDPDKCKIARSWKDKVYSGIGIVADAVEIISFLTGVASLPAIAPLVPTIWELLSNPGRRVILR